MILPHVLNFLSHSYILAFSQIIYEYLQLLFRISYEIAKLATVTTHDPNLGSNTGEIILYSDIPFNSEVLPSLQT